MAGWFEKLVARAKGARADVESKENSTEGQVSAEANRDATPPEGPVNSNTMFEILKLLAQIEYGMDVTQISASLSLSPDVALANCEALEQEMFVHHHVELAEWFIAQRGLEFLRVNQQMS